MPEETLADNVFRLPFLSVNLDALNLIVGDFTVILQVRVTPSALTEMVAVPCFLAVTTPESETTAILLELEDQVGTVLFDTEARSDMFCPRNSDAAVWDRVTVGLTTVT